jgi:hypothetical protein
MLRIADTVNKEEKCSRNTPGGGVASRSQDLYNYLSEFERIQAEDYERPLMEPT